MVFIMLQLSKSKFKPKALEVMRHVEETGEPVIITSHGALVLELRVYQPKNADPFEPLRGSVLTYLEPTLPVGVEDWEILK